MPPEPDRRLQRAVVLFWVASGVAMAAAAGVAAAILLPVLRHVDGLPGWVRPALLAATIAFGVVAVVVVPPLRYRTWRYAIREDEVDLRHGWLVVTRTIIPMARVQNVETTRSVPGQLLGLATLKVHTAAGAHEIPGLRSDEADDLRFAIALRAHVPDDV